MNYKYNYSIIIPHKNVPNLLQRCLDSIPKRDDTHVIVIDDNSNPNIVDFENFPGLNKPYTEIIFLSESIGAGGARNVGLKHAKDSKWIIFADSDDYFSKKINDKLDLYSNIEADLVFFLMDSVNSDTLLPSDRKTVRNNKFFDAIKNYDYDLLRYKMYGPTTKFISHDLIKKNQIQFDETPAANDAMFSIKIGFHAKNILTDNDVIYTVTDRIGSLVNTRSLINLVSRFNVTLNINSFLQEINKSEYRANIYNHLYELFKLKFSYGLKYTFYYMKHTPIKFIFKDTTKAIKHIL